MGGMWWEIFCPTLVFLKNQMCIKIEMCILRVKVLNSQISRQQLLGIQHESRVKALIPRVHWATAVQPLGGSGSRSLLRLQSRCQRGLQSSEGLTRTAGWASKVALSQGGLSSSHVDLFVGLRTCPPDVAAWACLDDSPVHSENFCILTLLIDGPSWLFNSPVTWVNRGLSVFQWFLPWLSYLGAY